MNGYRSLFLDLGTHVVSFYDIGKGKPIVFIHGLLGSKNIWLRSGIADELIDIGYRVIAIDLRGHGGSGTPMEDNYMGIEFLAGDVKKVIVNRNLKSVIVVGFSAGGPVALSLARQLYGVVDIRSILMISPMVRGYGNYFRAIARMMLKKYEEGLVHEVYKTSIQLAYSYEYLSKNIERVMMEIDRMVKYRRDTVKHAANFYISNSNYNIAIDMGKIIGDVAITVLASRNDKLIDHYEIIELANRYRIATITLNNTGHMIPLEDPKSIIDLILHQNV